MGFSAARLIQTYMAGLGICSMLQSSSARANLKGCRNKSQYCLRPDIFKEAFSLERSLIDSLARPQKFVHDAVDSAQDPIPFIQ